MSQGFSWSKIIGENQDAEGATPHSLNGSESASTAPVMEPPIAAPPVNTTTHQAEPPRAGPPQAAEGEEDLQSILSRLKDSGGTASPAPAPKFEDISPNAEPTFSTTIDGGVELSRSLSGEVAPEIAPSFGAEASLEEIANADAPPTLSAEPPPLVTSDFNDDEPTVIVPPVVETASAPEHKEDPLSKIFGKKKSTETDTPAITPPPSAPPTAHSVAPPVTGRLPVDEFEEPSFANAGNHTTPYDPSVMEMKLESKPSELISARDVGNVRKASESMLSIVDIHIDEILRLAVERKASDIHLTVGLPPMARIDGDIVPLPYQSLGPEDCRRLLYEILNDERLEKFERTHEADFSYAVKDVGRFRFNMYMQRGVVAASMRAIPTKIPDFETLGLPPIIREMAKRSSGLILVTGPTGSGKSTTIATMIDDINNVRKSHIITIEDPIEYLHTHKQCMVNQREMHSDTYSFHNALRAVLREDPDIILVGELRDLETIEAALTLAETGHLVFGTLHTRNAPSTIDRIIDVFPTDAQAQIRVLLSNTLEGVVSQQLLPVIGGGRCAAIEVMVATPAIKNLVREGKTHQMYSILETSSSHGMQTMDAMLADLYRSGRCDWEECLMRAIDKENFSRLAKR